ncbi:hypothetical protein [Chitinophaga japonensis]|uniref:PepSY-like beta-lactamase-inhibitor n=1 Tax=Chitinophaga japonensis TaxID=104662 RepID=A0A562TD26_CHIJA|nr:hypothetical protein [Chitinophaga japonensis]TWI91461.1 hypothetical protein LX66_0830 [Chitinophaga japonensis]
MKKMFLMLCVAAALTGGSIVQASAAHITETEATARLKEALNRSFANVTKVRWYTDDHKIFTAKFLAGENLVTAYFNAEGTLLSTRRYITEDQLPLAVITRIQKRYPDTWIRTAVEFDAGNVTTYYVTLEGAENWVVVKSDSNGQLSVYQKLKKA